MFTYYQFFSIVYHIAAIIVALRIFKHIYKRDEVFMQGFALGLMTEILYFIIINFL